MTKRDYVLIANALAYATAHALPLDKAITHLVQCMELQNPKLDATRFYAQYKKTLHGV